MVNSGSESSSTVYCEKYSEMECSSRDIINDAQERINSVKFYHTACCNALSLLWLSIHSIS